jgi:hypothetical protein
VTVDTEALIAAVRAGDIEAAQALLPVDPIVKRAREICGRHFGNPAMYLRGECDGGPQMGAVIQAIRSAPLPPPTEDEITLAARAACYAFVTGPDDAKYWCDRPTSDFLSGDADDTILMARVVDAMRAA